MLTLEQLKDFEPGPFATGIFTDGTFGVNITNTNKVLRWVAVRGDYADWSLYVDYAHKTKSEVARSGQKLYDKDNISKIVECNEQALAIYRM